MSAAATPPAMFAPARLWTRCAPVRSRMPATIAAVVVLPLVAEITALPRSQPGGQAPDGVGLEAHQELSGQRGAPAAGAARQRAGGAGGRHLDPERGHAGSSTCTAAGSARKVIGSSPTGSPSA